MTRVMKSYVGAILLNISRIKRVSWRSAGIVMGRANFTRFAAGEGGVISVRVRCEICGTREQPGQISLRDGRGFRSYFAFCLTASGLDGGQFGARGAIQQIFRVQKGCVNQLVRRVLAA